MKIKNKFDFLEFRSLEYEFTNNISKLLIKNEITTFNSEFYLIERKLKDHKN